MKIYLDLLPQEKKKELKRKKIFRKILRTQFLFLMPLFVFIVILLDVYYLLDLQRSSDIAINISGESQEKYRQLDKYEERFKKENETVEMAIKIKNGHLYWSEVLRKLTETTPDGIYVSDLSTKNYQFFLLGKARSRENLLDFKSRLEESGCFKDINVPLSNLVVKEDIEFQMDFNVAQECLRKK